MGIEFAKSANCSGGRPSTAMCRAHLLDCNWSPACAVDHSQLGSSPLRRSPPAWFRSALARLAGFLGRLGRFQLADWASMVSRIVPSTCCVLRSCDSLLIVAVVLAADGVVAAAGGRTCRVLMRKALTAALPQSSGLARSGWPTRPAPPGSRACRCSSARRPRGGRAAARTGLRSTASSTCRIS